MNTQHTPVRYAPNGMSLIELVVVMGLLAALATVALSALGGLGDRDRADTTRHRLDMIRQAVVGKDMEGGRFISDMGRLPVVQDTGEGKRLSELWDDTGLLLYGPQTVDMWDGVPPDWPETEVDLPELPGSISISCGWNGPYLSLNAEELFDGFGNGFLITNTATPASASDWTDGSSWTAADRIQGVLSLGSDAAFGGTEWTEEDQRCVFGNASVSLIVSIKILNKVGTTNDWMVPEKAPYVLEKRNIGTGVTVDEYVIVYFDGDSSWGIFRCSVEGTTGSSNDDVVFGDMPPATIGDTISDNGVIWEYRGPSHYINALRTALFLPNVDATSPIGWILDQTFSGTVTLDNNDLSTPGPYAISPYGILTPGIRGLYVYGFYKTGSNNFVNTIASGPDIELTELKPGANYITVYLTHKL